MSEREYLPRERIKFYKFITSRGEWDYLRQIVKELGWDRNKVRQFNRIRAYWEETGSQARRGDKTTYMDEVINKYFEKHGISPEIVIFDEAPEETEYRATFYDFEEVLDYGDGTLFFEEEDGIRNSPFAYIEIHENGEIDVETGDSGKDKRR